MIRPVGQAVGLAWASALALGLAAAGRGAPAPSATPTEVVVIGTSHFIPLLHHEGYTPAHLRALLEKAAPDVLAVEAPANVPFRWDGTPLDLQLVAKPWADERGVAVQPAAWQETDYQARWAAMHQALQAKGRWAQYQKVEQQFAADSAACPATCEGMNSDALLAAWRRYGQDLRRLHEADTPWDEWNGRILAAVLDVCRRHPGRRVAVVFGAAHAVFLLDGLATAGGVKVVPARTLLPLDPKAVEANARPTDYLKALLPLNFWTVSPADLERVRPWLAKVKAVPALHPDYDLFFGKYLLHQGRLEEALAQFRKVGGWDGGAIMAFDGKTPLREGGLMWTAIALMKMGRPDEARRTLEALLKTAGVTAETEQAARQMLAGLPIPPAEETQPSVP